MKKKYDLQKQIRDIHDNHVCRICNNTSYRTKCSFCGKYSCIRCIFILRDGYTKCKECAPEDKPSCKEKLDDHSVLEVQCT